MIPGDIQTGSVRDLPEFEELLEDAGAALWTRGVHQWPRGLHRRQIPRFAQQVDAGRLFIVRSEDSLLAGGIVTSLPSRVWPTAPPDTAYLRKLVVAPSAAGARLGARIVESAERWAASAGFVRLRLDCWDLNSRLRRYYRELGYVELHAVIRGDYPARLFEKALDIPAA